MLPDEFSLAQFGRFELLVQKIRISAAKLIDLLNQLLGECDFSLGDLLLRVLATSVVLLQKLENVRSVVHLDSGWNVLIDQIELV